MSDTETACPHCDRSVTVGIGAPCAECECGAYYADVSGARGWYASKAAYLDGEDPIKGSEDAR